MQGVPFRGIGPLGPKGVGPAGPYLDPSGPLALSVPDTTASDKNVSERKDHTFLGSDTEVSELDLVAGAIKHLKTKPKKAW
jgi:hypothetical protein